MQGLDPNNKESAFLKENRVFAEKFGKICFVFETFLIEFQDFIA
jgi:hypothetical protein